LASFRQFTETLKHRGELLHVSRTVEPVFELAALLKQAEARRKAVLFESVRGSEFPVIGGLLTGVTRFGLALDEPDPATYTFDRHRQRVFAAMDKPVPCTTVASAPCKQVVLRGQDADTLSLPVPTFFAGDSGPFITAALGISRDPDTGVVNVGFYRVQRLPDNRLLINASPNSGLNRILQTNHAAGTNTQLALVIGAAPAVLMAAASRVPSDRSELEVAGGLLGTPLATISAECSDLPVPAESEFVLEVEVDYAEQVANTMGEYGNLYGGQPAPVATVAAITHRETPLFHSIMAGAGSEHNALGMHILYGVEPDLQRQLNSAVPGVAEVRVRFNPPGMGNEGEVYVSFSNGREVDADAVCRQIFKLSCGGLPLARIIRLIVLLDTDIELDSRNELDWACATRAVDSGDYLTFSDVADNVRLGIDARSTNQEATRRLQIPGAAGIDLDDYL
jgi:2,5-furandicarboxylate decarboxylase 1